jgi:hypothetical protein
LDHFNANSIQQEFLRHTGELVFILGHVEMGSFVVEDRRGVETKIPLADIESLATKFGVTVFSLGCNSGFHVSRGVANSFYSSEAVAGLSEALHATTMEDFLQKLSSHHMAIIIDEIFVDALVRHVRAQVYDQRVLVSPKDFNQAQPIADFVIIDPKPSAPATLAFRPIQSLGICVSAIFCGIITIQTTSIWLGSLKRQNQ